MQSRTLTTTGLCLTLVLGGLAVAQLGAADTTTPLVLEQEQTTGKIVKVDLEKNMFALQTTAGETIQMKVNAETKYFVDGEEATKAEALQIGAKATVQHQEKQAARVDVRSE